MEKSKHVKEIKTAKVRWVHLSKNTVREIDYLRQNFKFHPLDLDDCLSPAQRPKLDEYESYLFLVMTFPYYDREQREIMASEVNFFIGPDYLVTVTDGKLLPLLKFFEQCQTSDGYREKYLGINPIFLFSEILDKLQLNLYPILDHIGEEINQLQKAIFSGSEKQMVKEILIIKRNIINFRKIVQAHKNVVRKLIAKKDKFFIPSNLMVYLANNLEQSKDIWDTLESLKENVEALHNTNESLISFRLNDIIKILTIISVILLPANLIAVTFGMKTAGMPLANNPYGFWLAVGLMAAVMLSLILYFKNKRWL
ncbi:MAG: magnesium transporter CorA family protein [Candidatus Komeilibacteria bacterium]|nr:magnesium transporter CorA family protein [Candidatus Komeilibacteria bacterium]